MAPGGAPGCIQSPLISPQVNLVIKLIRGLGKLNIFARWVPPRRPGAVAELYELTWKNYYEILQVSPDAKPKFITKAYKRLASLYHHLPPETTQPFSGRMADIDEAYEVLSDSVRRARYDQVFEARYSSQEAEAEEPTKRQIVDLMALTLQDVFKFRAGRIHRWLGWRKTAKRAILTALIALLVITLGGGSVAFAKPEHTLAAPFKGVAITMTEASHAAIGLIEKIRGVVATYERNIVSTSLQSMRVTEGLREVPVVTVSTNDMAYFPSPEHSLFPDYLDKRFSQFKYTVDSNGIVSVDTSGATTDAFLEMIEQRLKRLKEGQ
jgi:hypothetical protein